MRKVIEVPTDLFLELCAHTDTFTGQPELLAKLEPFKRLAQQPHIHIEGRRWFRSSSGNTYHTATVYADGELVVKLGQHYGHGGQYLTTAFDWLLANRPELIPGYVKGKTNDTIYLREVIGGTYGVDDVPREKDL